METQNKYPILSLKGGEYKQTESNIRILTCGRIVSCNLRSCNPISDILCPSMTIPPPADSINLNNATVREDLPAPVLPTIPT